VAPLPDFPLPQAFKEELLAVGAGLARIDSKEGSGFRVQGSGKATQDSGRLGTQDLAAVPPRAWICNDDSSRHLDRYQALAERLLIGDNAVDLAPVASHDPVRSLLASSRNVLSDLGIDPMLADIEAHYRR